MDRLTTEADALPGYGEPWSARRRERMRAITDEVMDDFERRGLTGHPRLWERERERCSRTSSSILDLDDDAHRAARLARRRERAAVRHARTRPGAHRASTAARSRCAAAPTGSTRPATAPSSSPTSRPAARGSSTTSRDDPVVAGTKLQLPLYAHAARAAFGNDDVEAGYWFVGRKRPRQAHRRAPRRRPRGTSTATRSRRSATGIRDGRFIARPPAADDFAWVQCAYCNPDGVGYGHVRDAERAQADGCRARGPLRPARSVRARLAATGGRANDPRRSARPATEIRTATAREPVRRRRRRLGQDLRARRPGRRLGASTTACRSPRSPSSPSPRRPAPSCAIGCAPRSRRPHREADDRAHASARADRARRPRRRRDRHAALVRAADPRRVPDPGGHAAARRGARRGRLVGRLRRALVGDVATDAGRRRPRRAAAARARGRPQRRPAALARARVRQRLGPHRSARARREPRPMRRCPTPARSLRRAILVGEAADRVHATTPTSSSGSPARSPPG